VNDERAVQDRPPAATQDRLRAAELDPPFPRKRILGVDVCVAGRSEAIDYVARRVARRQRTLVAFANTNLLTKAMEADVTDLLSRRFVILNDGIGLNVLARITTGTAFPENLNGSDLSLAILRALPRGTRVFLYGGRPEVLAQASRVLREDHGVEVCGTSHGYLTADELLDLPDRINAARADVVLVALGNLGQERWMLANEATVEATLMVGVGAFLDFVSGAMPRAPRWVRRLRLEWSYRLLNEPRRLWRRYSVDVLRLLAAAVRQRTARSEPPAASRRSVPAAGTGPDGNHRTPSQLPCERSAVGDGP
jgi:beta-1,4-glucosyltransferase